MDHFAGIDVSLEQSSVCIVAATGQIVHEAKVASEPEALVRFLSGLESAADPHRPGSRASVAMALGRFGHSRVRPVGPLPPGLERARADLGGRDSLVARRSTRRMSCSPGPTLVAVGPARTHSPTRCRDRPKPCWPRPTGWS